MDDVRRATRLVQATMRQVGVDPETGQYDADVIETGSSKTQGDRIKTVRALIEELQSASSGATFEDLVERADEAGISQGKLEHELEKLKNQGEAYDPANGYYRTT